MKHLIAIMALAASAVTAQAATVGIEREVLGSGTPGSGGWEQALPVLENDIYHAPQYMPQYPTAAVIYPRVIEVPCTRVGDTLKCEGYRWSPKMGRAEYLFFTTKVVEAPQPIIQYVPGPERIILKEVPIKKPRE